MCCNLAPRVDLNAASIADTPGSGCGRRVTTTSSGPSCTSSASSCVSARDEASAQCKSSRASTVGPASASRATTFRTATNVSRWRSTGLVFANARPAVRSIILANTGQRALSPIIATVALSIAGATTTSGWSGDTPAQLASKLR